jgi:hypothetical protein
MRASRVENRMETIVAGVSFRREPPTETLITAGQWALGDAVNAHQAKSVRPYARAF